MSLTHYDVPHLKRFACMVRPKNGIARSTFKPAVTCQDCRKAMR